MSVVVRRARIGCSGWNYAHWRDGVFYPRRCPARRWLGFYAERFDTVSRYLTHEKRLADAGRHLGLLLERIAPLVDSGKLGPLLWQLPPTFRRDDARLAAALTGLPQELRHAFEFRHPSWFADEPLALLRSHGIALVVADRPGEEAPQRPPGEFAYVRFHRGSRGRRGNYSAGELDDWAAVIARIALRREVFAYFNNDWEGFAPRNALELRARVSRARGRGVRRGSPSPARSRRGRGARLELCDLDAERVDLCRRVEHRLRSYPVGRVWDQRAAGIRTSRPRRPPTRPSPPGFWCFPDSGGDEHPTAQAGGGATT